MLQLNSKLQFMKGVGPKMAACLDKLGLTTIQDLFFYYPRQYRDFSQISKIADIANSKFEYRNPKSPPLAGSRQDARQILNSPDASVGIPTSQDRREKSEIQNGTFTIRGQILEINNKRTSRRRFTVTEAVVEDGTGSIKVVWFNQPFLLKMLPVGREVILNGKIEYNFYSREVVMESPMRAGAPVMLPVYGETAGITSRFISRLVESIKYKVESVEEYLPQKLVDTNLSFRPRETVGEISSGDPSTSLGMTKGEVGMTKGEVGMTTKLLPIQEAIINIHFPQNAVMLERARRRIAFDELFLISLRANLSKLELKKEVAPAISINDKKIAIATFLSYLPFELTGDQKKATEQILKDIGKNVPMNRLLNGDVGSGKTVVAAIAAFVAAEVGYRVAVMAPTSILANQHYETFCQLFEKSGISIGLYTRERQESVSSIKYQVSRRGTGRGAKKLDTKYQILNTNIVIGTQALIQEGIKLDNLGLVIVDEQHRFGVSQRAALSKIKSLNIKDKNDNEKLKNEEINEEINEKWKMKNGKSKEMKPHFLSMTATPIPRTLHLALFGDLDISIIKEKPAERKEIKTRLVEPQNRDKAYEFIRAHIKAGRQAFVVCPLIEGNDENQKSKIKNQNYGESFALGLFEDERKTVKREYEKLQKIFPEYQVGMLHGRMPATARSRPKGGKSERGKDEIMKDFSENKTQILVSTSVVEVGVDVPNATIMMIEDAERFGLAQLHQFRGRVGRAEHQSFCFLFSPTMSEKAILRLKALEVTSDGFKLAEIDLEQRGPGAVFGTEQSGMLDLKMADFSNRILIEEASSAAKSIVEKDPELKNHILLKEKISNYLQNKHLE